MEKIPVRQKNIKNGKGVRTTFSYNQLGENQKSGLLNELLEFVKGNIPFV